MSAEDVTEARLRDLKEKTKLLYDDLEDILVSHKPSVFDSRYSSSAARERSLSDSTKYPSDYYSYKSGELFIELRRKEDLYCVVCQNISFSSADIEVISSTFDVCLTLEFNRSIFGFVDFITGIKLFHFVLKIYFNAMSWRDGELF